MSYPPPCGEGGEHSEPGGGITLNSATPPPRSASRIDPPDKGEGKDLISSHYLKMPHAEKGLAVGLFGGSFNPPHAGHALVAEIALRRLALDDSNERGPGIKVQAGAFMRASRGASPSSTRA